jgi:hypothetical protein
MSSLNNVFSLETIGANMIIDQYIKSIKMEIDFISSDIKVNLEVRMSKVCSNIVFYKIKDIS